MQRTRRHDRLAAATGILVIAAVVTACSGGTSKLAAGSMGSPGGATPSASEVVASPVYRQRVGADADVAAIQSLATDVERLRRDTGGGWQARQDDTTGKAGVLSGGTYRSAAGTTPLAAVQTFLDHYGSLFGLTDPNAQVAYPDQLTVDDADTATLRVSQVDAGVPVDGTQVLVVVRAAKESPSISYAAAHVIPGLQLSTTPAIPATSVVGLAQQASIAATGAATLVVHTAGATPVLAWRIDGLSTPAAAASVSQRAGLVTAYFDASTGKLLEIRESGAVSLAPASLSPAARPDGMTGADGSSVQSLKLPPAGKQVQVTGIGTAGAQLTVTAEQLADGSIAFIDATEPNANRATGADLAVVFDASGAQDESGLPGKLATMQPGATPDPDTLTALWAAKQVLAFYRTNFGRFSWDNAGAPLISSVHFAPQNCNAFFSGGLGQMVYGPNCVLDGTKVTPTMVDISIVGHEITHGVTNTNTPQLYLSAQGGALNEANSDYFGVLVQDTTLQKPYTTEGGLICAGQPEYPGVCNKWPDGLNGGRSVDTGVTFDDFEFALRDIEGALDAHGDSGKQHANSLVWSNALWKIRTTFAKEDTGDPVTSTAAKRFDKIAYRALTVYWTDQTDMVGAGLALQQAAIDLGASATEQQAIAAQLTTSRLCQGCTTPAKTQYPVAVSTHIDYRPQVTNDGIVFLDESTSLPMIGGTGGQPTPLAPNGTTTVNVVAAGDYALESVIDDQHKQADLLLVNLKTGKAETLGQEALDGYTQFLAATPAISPDAVVWTQMASDGKTVEVLYRATSGGTVSALTLPSAPVAMGVDKQLVALELIDGTIVEWDVAKQQAAKLSSVVPTQASDAPFHIPNQIVVSGSRIAALVPTGGGDNAWAVLVYDASSGNFAVATESAAPVGIAMDANYLLWGEATGTQQSKIAVLQNRDVEAINLYGYSFQTGAEASILTERGQQGFPSLYGGVLAWQDSISGGDDIYAEYMPKF